MIKGHYPHFKISGDEIYVNGPYGPDHVCDFSKCELPEHMKREAMVAFCHALFLMQDLMPVMLDLESLRKELKEARDE